MSEAKSASTLPTLNDAIELAKGIAAVLGQQLTGDPYGGVALSELEAGEALAIEQLGNPAAFAHTVIDWYVLATGDFLHGTAEVARDEHNLAFSSAAVARATGENASIGWWLADPDLSVGDRIARTARVAYESIQEGKKLRSKEERTQYEDENRLLLDWAQKNQSAKQKLPDPTHRFKAMNPTYGRFDYHQYSSVAHGDLAITSKLVREKLGDLAADPIEPLWRILAACEYSLQLATRVAELRHRNVETLPGLWELFALRGAQFDAYQRHAAGHIDTGAGQGE